MPFLRHFQQISKFKGKIRSSNFSILCYFQMLFSFYPLKRKSGWGVKNSRIIIRKFACKFCCSILILRKEKYSNHLKFLIWFSNIKAFCRKDKRYPTVTVPSQFKATVSLNCWHQSSLHYLEPFKWYSKQSGTVSHEATRRRRNAKDQSKCNNQFYSPFDFELLTDAHQGGYSLRKSSKFIWTVREMTESKLTVTDSFGSFLRKKNKLWCNDKQFFHHNWEIVKYFRRHLGKFMLNILNILKLNILGFILENLC